MEIAIHCERVNTRKHNFIAHQKPKRISIYWREGQCQWGTFLDANFSVSSVINSCSGKSLKDRNSEVDRYTRAGF